MPVWKIFNYILNIFIAELFLALRRSCDLFSARLSYDARALRNSLRYYQSQRARCIFCVRTTKFPEFLTNFSHESLLCQLVTGFELWRVRETLHLHRAERTWKGAKDDGIRKLCHVLRRAERAARRLRYLIFTRREPAMPSSWNSTAISRPDSLYLTAEMQFRVKHDENVFTTPCNAT